MLFFAKKPPQNTGRHRQPRKPDASMNPQVFSYYSRSSEPAASRPQKRQSFRQAVVAQKASRAARYWAQRFGAALVLIVLVASLVNLLLITPQPRIITESTDGARFLRDSSVYQTAAQQLFAESILNRNKVTINTTAIARDLQAQFPELSDVSITLPLVGHRPVVYLEPTEPVLILTTRDNQAYVIDENGRALANVSQVKNLASFHLATLRDESDVRVIVGKLALSSDTVAFIRSFLFQLRQQQLEVSTLVLPAGKSELDVYLKSQSYFVKCNLEAHNAREQAGSFLAVRSDLRHKGITPKHYIDVRVEGRAYYK